MPYYIKHLRTRCLIPLGYIESDVLMHSFHNPMLFVEAMTHSSYHASKEVMTPSNERLAYIGRHLLETLMVQEILRGAGIDTKASYVLSEGASLLPETGVFSLAERPHGVDKDPPWPGARPPTTREPCVKAAPPWKKLLNACCNHFFFAIACCDPDVKLHAYILRTSAELDAAIEDLRA